MLRKSNIIVIGQLLHLGILFCTDSDLVPDLVLRIFDFPVHCFQLPPVFFSDVLPDLAELGPHLVLVGLALKLVPDFCQSSRQPLLAGLECVSGPLLDSRDFGVEVAFELSPHKGHFVSHGLHVFGHEVVLLDKFLELIDFLLDGRNVQIFDFLFLGMHVANFDVSILCDLEILIYLCK